MDHGKNEENHLQRKRGRGNSRKAGTLLLSLLLLAALAIGGTLAYLTADTTSLENTFKPSRVACEVTEEFDGSVKSEVNVKNTGDTDAYIRVKLVTYRVNEEGRHIGGTAEIPGFTPGEGWVQHNDGYYYYTSPVAPDQTPATDLIEQIKLTGSYPDADGGRQVIEVMAEAIQSGPPEAVGKSWGVSISEGSVSAYEG